MPTPSLAVTPPTAVIATSEVLPWGFDYSPLLQPGESVSAATSALWDVTDPRNPTQVTLVDLPQLLYQQTPGSTVVSQTVRGSELVALHEYRLDVTVSILTREVTMSLSVSVPY